MRGLGELHANGIIHRNLKPSNIMINNQGIVKIADFATAVHINDKIDGKFPEEKFSRWYTSPEM